MSKPVFVLVTAKNCGACAHFKQTWPSVKLELESLGQIRIIEIDVPSIGVHTGDNFPQDLNRWVGWYPSMLLFNGSSWDTGMKAVEEMKKSKDMGDKTKPRTKIELEGSIFRGHFSSDGRPEPEEGPMLNATNISSWVQTELASPKFQRKGSKSAVVTSTSGSSSSRTENLPILSLLSSSGSNPSSGAVGRVAQSSSSNNTNDSDYKPSRCRLRIKPMYSDH